MESNDLIEVLQGRINRCVEAVIPAEKVSCTEELIGVAANDLLKRNFADAKDAERYFKNFINSTLSAIEMTGVPDNQYKPLRRTLLKQIYGALDAVIAGINTETK